MWSGRDSHGLYSEPWFPSQSPCGSVLQGRWMWVQFTKMGHGANAVFSMTFLDMDTRWPSLDGREPSFPKIPSSRWLVAGVRAAPFSAEP